MGGYTCIPRRAGSGWLSEPAAPDGLACPDCPLLCGCGRASGIAGCIVHSSEDSRWMRYQSYRRQHLPIGSGITEAACK